VRWSGGHSVERSQGRWVSRCRLPAYAFNAGDYILSVDADVPYKRVIFYEESVLSMEGGADVRGYWDAIEPRSGRASLDPVWASGPSRESPLPETRREASATVSVGEGRAQVDPTIPIRGDSVTPP